MGLFLTILAWLAIALGTLLLTVLLVPWHLEAWGWVHAGSASGGVRGDWGFGLVRVKGTLEQGIHLYLFGLRVHRIAVPVGRGKKEKKSTVKKKSGGRFTLVRLRRMLSLVKRVLSTLWFQGRVSGVFGLAEPSDTAVVAELVRQLSGVVPGVSVRLSPDYQDAALEVEGELRLAVWPVWTVLVALWLLTKRETRELLRAT